MTTFSQLTPSQRERAIKNSRKNRSSSSQKDRVIAEAKTAIRNNPKLTKTKFISMLPKGRYNLSEKSIRNYLSGWPFSETVIEIPKEKYKPVDIWDAGYRASILGSEFHRNLVPRSTAIRN